MAASAFILGIILGDYVDLPSFLLLAVLILSLVTSIYFYFKKSKILDYLLLFTLFLAGFWRYELKTRDFPLNHISNFLDLDRPVQVTGEIVADPDVREDKTYLTVNTYKIEWENKSIKADGKILVKIKQPSLAFNYGDLIQLKGYLNRPLSQRNPGAFDYRRYLGIKGIYGLVTLTGPEKIQVIENQNSTLFISKIVIPAKKFIKKIFAQTLDQPHQALLAGFVLGEKRQIPDEIYQMFSRTGTLHLLAVSGFNVGVIVLFLLGIVKLLRIPKWINLSILLLGILIFSFITNNQPSVVRASIMMALFLLAFYLEREPNFVNIIAFAALLILFYSPLTFFDVSFQLSFAATFGIGFMVPKIENILLGLNVSVNRYVRNWLIIPISVSLAATLFTLPVTAYYFNQFSPVVVLSNLVLIPLTGLAVIIGCLSSILGTFSLGLAQIVSACNWLLLTLIIETVKYFGAFPWSYMKVDSPTTLSILVFFLLLILATLSLESKKFLKILLLSGFLLGTVWAGQEILATSDQSLKITCLDMGKEEAIFIQLPGKQNILVGTGSPTEKFNQAERIIAPFLYKKGIRKIDHLILTQKRPEHVRSLNYLKENFSVRKIWSNSYPPDLLTNQLSDSTSLIPFLDTILFANQALKVSLGLPDNYNNQKRKQLSDNSILFIEYKNFIWIRGWQPELFENLRGNEKKIICTVNLKEIHELNSGWPRANEHQTVLIIENYDRWKDRLEEHMVKNQKQNFKEIWWTKENGAITLETNGQKLKIKPMVSKN